MDQYEQANEVRGIGQKLEILWRDGDAPGTSPRFRVSSFESQRPNLSVGARPLILFLPGESGVSHPAFSLFV